MLTRGLTLPRLERFSLGAGRGGSVASSMPLGLSVGGSFRPFSRAISARSFAIVCLSSAVSPSNWITSSLSASADSSSRWYRKFGQWLKLGSLLRRTDLDDEQTAAVFGGVQGEGCA